MLPQPRKQRKSPEKSPGKTSSETSGSERKRYQVVFKPSAVKELKDLPEKSRSDVAKAINGLAVEPRPQGVEKIKGAENLYRIRVGDYRVVFEVDDAVVRVLVVKIGDRKDVYRFLGR